MTFGFQLQWSRTDLKLWAGARTQLSIINFDLGNLMLANNFRVTLTVIFITFSGVINFDLNPKVIGKFYINFQVITL